MLHAAASLAPSFTQTRAVQTELLALSAMHAALGRRNAGRKHRHNTARGACYGNVRLPKRRR